MRLTTVDLRLVGRPREPKRALVKDAVKGANFAARGGVVESFAFPGDDTSDLVVEYMKHELTLFNKRNGLFPFTQGDSHI
jgi:hypothetical protein